MASLAERPRAAAGAGLAAWATPTALYWLAATVLLGGIAAHFASGPFLDQISRDVWQHVAALRALIADPLHPANPFVPTDDPSRHFHPYWLGMAVIARAAGWDAWQAVGFAAFVSAGALAVGIFVFARAFYRDPWGPLALLAAMLLGWIAPLSHTGYHSLATLLEGIAYPAALLIGLSLGLWALVIAALASPRRIAWLVPLCALMFAVHQLGAMIGFLVAGCFVLLWPGAGLARRAAVAMAMIAGLLIAGLWPFMNPLAAMLQPGNSRWSGGPDFLVPYLLIGAFVPQAAGLAGLLAPAVRRRSWPILAALCVFLALFFFGQREMVIATRFIMPAVLMLHIGLGAVLLGLARRWPHLPKRRQLTVFALGTASLIMFAWSNFTLQRLQSDNARHAGSLATPALELTRDIPDRQPVAAYDVSVWPIVATGQRALSVPWPEPGIPDLARRQAATERLFDPRLTREERLALARSWGVRVLVMHRDGAQRRQMPPRLIETLTAQSTRRSAAGPLLRFDLY